MRDHVRGNPNAGVVLLEYADFECPYCGMAYPFMKRLAKRFHDDLAEVFRPFPLAEIHPHAMHAAQAAEAAGVQGKFWQMHDVLFENQERLDDAALVEYAQGIGLDVERFTTDFASQPVIERIERSVQLGLQEGVNGTPTFFLNGQRLELENYQDLEPTVARAIALMNKVPR
jgi:protein-disulfide isomerase